MIDSLKYMLTSDSNKCCVICLSDMIKGEFVVPLPCLHTFHENCFLESFKHSYRCPTCQIDIIQSLRNRSDN